MQESERRRIALLIVKDLSGKINDLEKKELALWAAASPGNRQLLDQFADEAWRTREMLELDAEDREETWQMITGQIAGWEADGEPSPRTAWKSWTAWGKVEGGGIFFGRGADVRAGGKSWAEWKLELRDVWMRWRQVRIPLWVVVTKSLLIICLVSLYFLLRNNAHEQKVAVRENQNFRINISLPDGKEVDATEMPVGRIAQWANLSLWKEKNGVLAYRSQGDSQRQGDSPSQGDSSGKPEWVRVTTPRGGWYNVILPDGSTVQINAASSLSVSTGYGHGERNVKLDGEAYFEVAARRPAHFTVLVKDMLKVIALGTGFNVTAYADDPFIKTTLLHGAVQVEDVHDAFSRVLRPGEQYLRYENGKDSLLRKVDTNGTTAWKNGDFIFTGEPLTNIMRQIGRWYDARISYRDTPSINLTMRGSHQDELGVLLNRLQATGQVQFIVENSNRVIVSRPPL